MHCRSAAKCNECTRTAHGFDGDQTRRMGLAKREQARRGGTVSGRNMQRKRPAQCWPFTRCSAVLTLRSTALPSNWRIFRLLVFGSSSRPHLGIIHAPVARSIGVSHDLFLPLNKSFFTSSIGRRWRIERRNRHYRASGFMSGHRPPEAKKKACAMQAWGRENPRFSDAQSNTGCLADVSSSVSPPSFPWRSSQAVSSLACCFHVLCP